MSTENTPSNDPTPPTNDAAPKLSRREAMKRMAKTAVGVCAIAVSQESLGGYYYSCLDLYYSCNDWGLCYYSKYGCIAYYVSYGSYNSYSSYCSHTGPTYYSVGLYCSGTPQYCSATHYHSASTYC